jgi:hypothetical protein
MEQACPLDEQEGYSEVSFLAASWGFELPCYILYYLKEGVLQKAWRFHHRLPSLVKRVRLASSDFPKPILERQQMKLQRLCKSKLGEGHWYRSPGRTLSPQLY